VSPLYFFLRNLATFFSRQLCSVTPDFFFAKTDDLFCSSLYRLLLLSLGCHPLEGVALHILYLSDLVSPLFFVNLPTKFFPLGVTPLEGVTRGGPPPRPRLMTPLPSIFAIQVRHIAYCITCTTKLINTAARLVRVTFGLLYFMGSNTMIFAVLKG